MSLRISKSTCSKNEPENMEVDVLRCSTREERRREGEREKKKKRKK